MVSQPKMEPTELIVALDFPSAERALQCVHELRELPLIFKVGSELFLSAGLELVSELVRQKHRVFLDLKFHDIPSTVAKAAHQAVDLGVEMFTLHLLGGREMIKQVRHEIRADSVTRPKVLGVSVLTSFDSQGWSEVMQAAGGHSRDLGEAVRGLVAAGVSWGVDGIVCSAHELAHVRAQHPSLYTVVPGIRPAGVQSNDQARVMSPSEARGLGASAIVVGRPITQSPDPRQVAEQILKDLT